MTTFGKLSKLKEDPEPINPPPAIKLKSHIKEDIPDAYLKGWVEFYKLKFKVTPDVLIPRPETELLVDEVLNFTLRAKREVTNKNIIVSKESSHIRSNNNFTILDLGTGSGNIAISIAKNLPKAGIFATDISDAALEIARENAKKHRVENKIFFLKSDLLSSVHPKGGKLDIIVANLPYIPSSRISFLDPSVRDFEPLIALDGGPDGFDLYRKLFRQITEGGYKPGLNSKLQTWFADLKLLVCEIDESQEKIAITEAKKYFPEAKIEVKKDLAKKPRMLIITLSS